jgi:hypothetical protein
LALKKHVDVEHGLFAEKLDEEVNNLVKTQVEKQPTKKRQNVSSSKFSKFFFPKFPYKKDELQHNFFFEYLALLIVKNHLPIHLMESSWLKQFFLQLNPHIVFPSIKKIS